MKIGYYPNINIKNNVVYFLEEYAKKRPSQIAFYFLPKNALQSGRFNHDSITYEDFNNKAKNTAGGFLQIGIRKNDRIIVFVPISPQLYISIAALQRIGAIPVLLDSWSRQEQLAEIVQNSEPRGIIAPATWLQAFKSHLDHFGINIKISADENSAASGVIELANMFSERSQE